MTLRCRSLHAGVAARVRAGDSRSWKKAGAEYRSNRVRRTMAQQAGAGGPFTRAKRGEICEAPA